MTVFAAVLLLFRALGLLIEIGAAAKRRDTDGAVGCAIFFPAYLFVGLALLGVL